MAKHEVTYDQDGLSTCDPWSLVDYLCEDGLSAADINRVSESVLSWLTEYDTAACDITEAMRELTPPATDGQRALPICPTCNAYADLPSTRGCPGTHPDGQR